MTYDALNRVTVAKDVWSGTLTMTYDGVGNRTQVEDSKGGVDDVPLRRRGPHDQRQFSGVAARCCASTRPTATTASWRRSAATATWPASTLVGSTTYLYDAADRTTGIHHRNGSGTVLASYAYNYDDAGRLTSEVDQRHDADVHLRHDQPADRGRDEHVHLRRHRQPHQRQLDDRHRQPADQRRHLDLHLRRRGEPHQEEQGRRRRDVDLRLRPAEPHARGRRTGPPTAAPC